MYPTLRIYDTITQEDVKVSTDNPIPSSITGTVETTIGNTSASPVPSEIIKNIANYLEPLGASSLTVDNATAKWLYQANIPNGATLAGIVVDSSAIRYTLDGLTAPVAASEGTSLAVGEYLLLNTNDIFKFKCISQTATSAVLRIEFFRYTATSLRETTIAEPLPSFQLVAADLSGALPNSNLSLTRGAYNGRVNKYGLIEALSANLLIVNYDPVTLIQYRGVGIFSGYTNLLYRGAQFDNASWTKTNATASSANAIISPTGTALAETLTATGSSTTHYATQSRTANSTQKVAGSVFIKRQSQSAWTPTNMCVLRLQNNAASQYIEVAVNKDTLALTNFATANGTVTSSEIIAYPNNWYLINLIGTINSAGGSESCGTLIFVGGGSYTASGNEILGVYGAQLTQSGIAYPYVDTPADAGVSVAATVLSITAANLPRYSSTQITVMVVGRFVGHDTNAQYLFSLDDGSSNNRFIAYYDNTNNKVRVSLIVAGVTVYDSVTNNTLLSVAKNTEFKLAVSMKGGQINVSLYNGSSYASDSLTSAGIEMPLGTLTLRVGSDYNGANQLDGYEDIYYTPYYKTLSAITTDIENI